MYTPWETCKLLGEVLQNDYLDAIEYQWLCAVPGTLWVPIYSTIALGRSIDIPVQCSAVILLSKEMIIIYEAPLHLNPWKDLTAKKTSYSYLSTHKKQWKTSKVMDEFVAKYSNSFWRQKVYWWSRNRDTICRTIFCSSHSFSTFEAYMIFDFSRIWPVCHWTILEWMP